MEKLLGLQVSKNQICNPFRSSIRLRIHWEAGPPTIWVFSKFRDTAPLRMWLYQVMEAIMKLRGDVRVCSDAVLLDVWCVLRKFLFKLRYCGFTKPSNLRYLEIFEIISTRFAVFFCYSLRCLYVILCDFAVFVSPLSPLSKSWIKTEVETKGIASYRLNTQDLSLFSLVRYVYCLKGAVINYWGEKVGKFWGRAMIFWAPI